MFDVYSQHTDTASGLHKCMVCAFADHEVQHLKHLACSILAFYHRVSIDSWLQHKIVHILACVLYVYLEDKG